MMNVIDPGLVSAPSAERATTVTTRTRMRRLLHQQTDSLLDELERLVAQSSDDEPEPPPLPHG